MFRQNCRNHTWTAFYSTLQLQWTLFSILFTFFLLSNSANSSRCLSVLLSSDSSKYSPAYRNPETMSGMEWHFKDMVSYSTVQYTHIHCTFYKLRYCRWVWKFSFDIILQVTVTTVRAWAGVVCMYSLHSLC